ncbi:hypothetical protein [Ectobacillus antri]|uniref:hypothetical protein n=1 Tax=Ectobacillus antri TaxID=2486280 RepID=UPI000F59E125|nr:hypothetical protein [Ectobacillus antri]
MDQYLFSKEFSLLEKDNEICLFWKKEGKGTILRGLGAHLFSTLWESYKDKEFSFQDIFNLELDLEKDLLEDFLIQLNEKRIINRAISNYTEYNKFNHLNLYTFGEDRLLDIFEEKLINFMQESTDNDFLINLDKHNVTFFRNKDLEYVQIDKSALNLILLLDNVHNIQQHLKLNNIAVLKGVPFLSCRTYGTNFELGPFVLSGNSACFECYWNRLQSSNVRDIVPDWVLELSLNTTESHENGVYGKALYDYAINETCLEVFRYIHLKHVPITIGNVLRREIISNRIRFSPVMELFNCKTCLQSEGSYIEQSI